MKTAFVFASCDMNKLEFRVLRQLAEEPLLCWASRHMGRLREADDVYFVASPTSMCSTAHQETVMAAFPKAEHANRWLLRLDDAVIPLGLQMLQGLPEKSPA